MMPMVIAAYVFALVLVLAIAQPLLLIYFILISSATSSLIRILGKTDVGDTDMSTSGLRWLLIAAATIILNLSYLRKRAIPKHYYIFIIFMFYAFLRWTFAPSLTIGMKDLLMYALGPLAGIISYHVFSTGQTKHIEQVEEFIRYSFIIILMIFGLSFYTGGLEWTVNGPKGIVVARTIALFTATVLTVSLGRWRYDLDPRKRLNGLLISTVILGTIGFTLSRMATGISLLLTIISRHKPSNTFRLLAAVTLSFVVVVVLFLSISSFRERTFKRGEIPNSFAEMVETFDSSGRINRMWPAALASALESPLIGHGPGSARTVVALIMTQHERTEYNPHNEYLQVFHDFGLIGLLLLLGFWIPMMIRYWRLWNKSDREQDVQMAKWSMVAFLCVTLCVITAITANTFHYPFVTTTAFIIVGIADAVQERKNISNSAYPQILPEV